MLVRFMTEFCKFDVNDGNGQLSFKIELRSAIHSDIVLDLSKASTHSPAGHSTPFAHDTFINQENIWSPFLSQFQTFMSAVDGVAGVLYILQSPHCLLNNSSDSPLCTVSVEHFVCSSQGMFPYFVDY